MSYPLLPALAALALGALAGCSAKLPQMGEITKIGGETATATPEGEAQGTAADGAVAAQAPASPAAPAAAPPVVQAAKPATTALSSGSGDQIVGFRNKTVILYAGSSSNEGERVPSASLSLPLTFRPAPDNTSRLGIMTVYGARWIARSEVTLGGASSTATP